MLLELAALLCPWLMLQVWSVSEGSEVLFFGCVGGWGRERIVALREEVRMCLPSGWGFVSGLVTWAFGDWD